MKNNSLGKVISVVLQFLLCLIIAFAIWFIVQYSEYNTQEEATSAAFAIITALRVL